MKFFLSFSITFLLLASPTKLEILKEQELHASNNPKDISLLQKAEDEILTAYDNYVEGEALPIPTLKGSSRMERDWLLSSLQKSIPKIPFKKGTRSNSEAEQICILVQTPIEKHTKLIQMLHTLHPILTGSHAAIWRWGQSHTRNKEMPKDLRLAWEDLLLSTGVNPIIQGWALRHALCFALAEADEFRFSHIKDGFINEYTKLVIPFQNAFGLLGGKPPRFYLWSLPNISQMDVPLHLLGKRIWIAPIDELPPPVDTDSLWIIPAFSSNLPSDSSSLDVSSRNECKEIINQIMSKQILSKVSNTRICFAASRAPFEEIAFIFFPIEILLDDEKGIVKHLRIGDAAKERK